MMPAAANPMNAAAMMPATAREILLVGSVPLASASDVFATCAQALGDRIKRLPDGETGARTNWIACQRDIMRATPGLKELPSDRPVPQFGLDPAHKGPLVFGPLGYARAARDSYAAFVGLRMDGPVTRAHRFQVSLPTPLAVLGAYFTPEAQAEAEAPYTERLFAELDEILDAIPHHDLAIQWDVAVEFMVLEGLRPVHFAPAFEGIVARLVAACERVPRGAELGLHFCYGDSGHKHFKEPADTALMVKLANAVLAEVHVADWLHLPVPRDRDDAAYFAPLADLKLPPPTALFLGLIHAGDGLAGARRRIAAAERFVHGFGLATECGFGRRKPETIPDLLKLHVEA